MAVLAEEEQAGWQTGRQEGGRGWRSIRPGTRVVSLAKCMGWGAVWPGGDLADD